MFGVLGLSANTRNFLTRKFNLNNILFLALFIRSMSFILMPIWSNVSYFIAVSVVYSLLNSLVQPIINTLISLNAKPEGNCLVLTHLI